MDKLLKRFDARTDGDLTFIDSKGIAYQTNFADRRVAYDSAYYAKVQAYEGTPIAKQVNASRCELIARHVPAGAKLLDVGCGTGAFLRTAHAAGYKVKGWDVLDASVAMLLTCDWYADDPFQFEVVTFWDVLEHLDDPSIRLKSVKKGAHLFASIPVFEDQKAIRQSKHYRPGEHLYYWSTDGFVAWMALYGFRMLEVSEAEHAAGRQDIRQFAFIRDLPDFHDHIGAYREIHSSRHYGASATGEYLDIIARVVKELQPKSILDYGCGRSDLASHFWLDGGRMIARYDPAIPQHKTMPEGRFDLVFCTDVMEHIPMDSVDRILAEVKGKGDRAIFTISTLLARAKLPDGRNAHVTLLTKSEWRRWVASYFGGNFREIPAKWDHELILVAGMK